MNIRRLAYCDKRGSVAETNLLNCLDQFATLATRLDSFDVTVFPLECHVRHVCHIEKGSPLDRNTIGQTYIGSKICFQWLARVMEEGHLEASQPAVGKHVGWPQRMVTIRSLWIDFRCWCSKHQIQSMELPEEWMFYELLDRIFIRHEDKYEIPSLNCCREVFAVLRGQYECG